MKINIEVNSLAKSPLADAFVRRIAAAVIETELSGKLIAGEIELSIAFVGAAKIRQINKKYRGIDRPTDVLSFEGDDIAGAEVNCPRLLGELVVCSQIIKQTAKESGADAKKETAWAIIHGILHLLGYGHENDKKSAKLMRDRECHYLSKLKVEKEKGKTTIKNFLVLIF